MKEKHIYSGLIEFEGSLQSINVLRDTGSMIHAVHKRFVKPTDYLGKTLSLITFGGKKETFDLANICIDTPFIQGKVTACVLDNYPPDYMYYDVLIGNGGTLGSPTALDPSPDVVKAWEETHRDTHVLGNLTVNEECHFNTVKSANEILTSNEVQTRAQKQNENKVKKTLNDKVLNFDISYTELANLQKEDETLSKYFDFVNCEAKKTKTGSCSFEIRNGILVRLFKSDRYSLVQVVVPEPLRAKIISLGHDMLFSAHMGIQRTIVRVTSSFYWPGITVDVRQFCKSCKLCLKTKPKGRTPRAPLQCGVPVIDKPFYKVGTDLIGPLPISDNKN